MNRARRRRATARLLGPAALTAIVVMTAPPPATAQEGEPPTPGWQTPAWAGGHTPGMGFAAAPVTLSGTFRWVEPANGEAAITYLIVDTELVGKAEATGDCEPPARQYIPVFPGDGPARVPGDPAFTGEPHPVVDEVDPDANTHAFSVTLTPECNAVYDVTVRAVVDPPGRQNPIDLDGRFDPDSSTDPTISPPLELDGIRVDLPPPVVPGLEAVLNPDRTVSLTWTAPSGYAPAEAPPDFIGYGVQRAEGEGDFHTLVSTTALAHVDATLPPGGGLYRYRVLAARWGSGGEGSPPFVVGPAPPGPGQRITIQAPSPPPTTARTPPPTRAPRATAPPQTPATTVDPGFDSTLPFDDPIVGPEEAELPEDAAGLLEVDEEPVGSGILVPFATALVILVWALHIRHLSQRASSPA